MQTSGLIHNKHKGAGGTGNLKGLSPSCPEGPSTCPDLLKFYTVAGIGLILVLFLCFISLAHADQEYSDEQIANAIWYAEGGNKTNFPFGILSVKCEGYDACRRICLNSIRNAKKRWEKAGKPEDFIVFMGRRYSPPDINPNWVRLVKYFLEKNK